MGLNNINDIEKFFLERVVELENQCHEHTTWIFLCASAMINYLVNLVNGRETNKNDYKRFINVFMSEEYKNFQFLNGIQDLDIQMYHTLRCGIVHNFSLFPDTRAIRAGARQRSIALTHKDNNDGNHLSNYVGIRSNLDAALFVAEDFISDIKATVKKIFNDAKVNAPLEQNILNWIKDHPPIMSEALQ
jgi:hypothetical protein